MIWERKLSLSMVLFEIAVRILSVVSARLRGKVSWIIEKTYRAAGS